MQFPDGTWKYDVSNFGRVRINEHLDAFGRLQESRILKPVLDTGGRRVVQLHTGRKPVKRIYVHKLVAAEFIEKPADAELVKHIDGDKTNNRVDNLAWVSYHPNGEIKPRVRHPGKRHAVRQYDLKCNFIAEYPSVAAAVKAMFLVSGGQISQCCNRVPGRLTSAGYMWRYADDDEFANN